MTDAEKMREAAGRIRHAAATSREVFASSCDHTIQAIDYMEQLLLAAIRALPIVDASAPAADCQQAGLVTVDAGLLDEVKAALRTASESLEWCARGRMASASLETYPTLWAASTRDALARLKREVG